MDPVFEIPFSQNCFPFPACTFDEIEIKKLKIDAIFISHIHDDHLCFKSLNRMDRATAIYLYAHEEIYFRMLKALGFQSVHQLKINNTVQIKNEILVTPRLALDSNVDCLLHIQMGETHILNVVDSWVDPQALQDMKRVNKWDLVLWPFQTMRELQVLQPSIASRETEIPIEWAEVLKTLNPKAIVPSSCQFQHESWSWYNQALFPISYKDFENWCAIHIPNAKFVRLDPGQTVELTKTKLNRLAPLSFVDLKNENEDYKYNMNYKGQSLDEIATHFPILGQSQRRFIEHLLENEIPKFLINNKDDMNSFFIEGCRWKLNVYWGQKEVSEKNYVISKNSKAIPKNEWLTEICGYKLYSAWQKGETLTSLYMRINDQAFSNHLDVLEDPLIHFLFDGKAHQFHLNQLDELGIKFNV